MSMIPTLKARFLTRSKHMRIKNQKNRECIDDGVDPEVDNKSIPKCRLYHTSCYKVTNHTVRHMWVIGTITISKENKKS